MTATPAAATAPPVSLVCFGKLPSRGDFVRTANRAPLTEALDRWLARGLEAMAVDPRWKETYDRAAPLRFAFLGARSRSVLAGRLQASADASGRRFPFVVAGSFRIPDPLDPLDPDGPEPLAFMARSPAALSGLWARCEAALQAAIHAADPATALARLEDADGDVGAPPAESAERTPETFLDRQTIGSLEAMLRRAGHALDLRRTLLALGLLLQPVPMSGQNALDKGLALPLPGDPLQQPLVAALWLDLVARFLRRGDFELALFVPDTPAGAAPRLLIGFSGGAPASLRAALDPELGREVFLDLTEADWVDAEVDQDYAVKKLSSYLEQPRLSLRQARDTFGEVFLGE